MRRLFLAGAAIAALALGACGSGPEHGVVVDKKYDDPDTGLMPMVVSTGKSTTTVLVPYSDGPHWELKLKDGDKQGWVDVDPTTYDKTKIGDHV